MYTIVYIDEIVAYLKKVFKRKIKLEPIEIEEDYNQCIEVYKYDEEQDDKYNKKHGIYSGTINLSYFPGCCGILLLHSFYIENDEDIDIFFEIIQAIKARTASRFGCIMYTTVSEQEEIINVLRRANFDPIDSFNNNGTDNEVSIWTCKIRWEEDDYPWERERDK